MKKVNKSAILAMQLTDFGIKPLSNWLTRQERGTLRQMRECEARLRKYGAEQGENYRKNIQEDIDHMKASLVTIRAEQLHTVGDLIKRYPYRFNTVVMRRGYGLGNVPITEFKNKLRDLGLTPNDWPALVDHDQLLENLSKKVILTLPIQEVLVTSGGYYHKLHGYLNCSEEELSKKTVKDFISINPFDVVEGTPGTEFFEHRKQQFVAIWQKLKAKGFTRRDGAFFKWNPEKQSLSKAMKVLEKYKLTSALRERFAKIVVAERWII